MNELPETGAIFYLRNREDVHEDMFEPVSKSQWKLLRELSPEKSRSSYESYVESCNSRYLAEVNTRERSKVELISIMWDLRNLNRIQYELVRIQKNSGFIRWATDNDVNHVSEILKLWLKNKKED